MPALKDIEIERLSDLLARGDMDNADEIATLLKLELGEQIEPAPECDSLHSYLDMLLQIADPR